MLLSCFIVALLFTIFIQDIKTRSVYWFLFPTLIILFFVRRLLTGELLAEIGYACLLNIGFLVMQLGIVSAYFSIKNKGWTNITVQLLGWGDVLFLLSIACYLSVLNFILFYVGSLILSLIIWVPWQFFKTNKSKQIPLAGLQAFLFVLYLASDWWIVHVNVTQDDWLSQMLIK